MIYRHRGSFAVIHFLNEIENDLQHRFHRVIVVAIP